MSHLHLSIKRGTTPARGPVPVLGFVGASGAGKTTLISAIVPILADCGYRVGIMKHARHGFDLDQPGKDSYRMRLAGAAQVLVASRSRWALMAETPDHTGEPAFHDLLRQFDPSAVDVVLVEGFARERYRKIEVHRPSQGEPPKCWPDDPDVIAVASDQVLAVMHPVQLLDLNQPQAIAHFVLERLTRSPEQSAAAHVR
jgi:molybdopterin-guanine dinucleotide biosynthesis protein B